MGQLTERPRQAARTLRILSTLTLASSLLAVAGLAPTAWAEVVVLTPSQDNTLYENASGDLSNGAGDFLFAGTTSTGNARRALVAFDVASFIPAGSTIESVTLTLEVSNAPVGSPPQSVGLHRVLRAWGEGASDASGPEGMGTDAEPGDATWIHTSYDTAFWTTPGGDFAAAASASQTVGDFGPFTWGSSAAMVADVQGWVDAPAMNFGWLLLGDEAVTQSARRYDSRDNPDATVRPQLTVEFSGAPAPPAAEIPTLSQWGALLLALALFAFGVRRLRFSSR